MNKNELIAEIAEAADMSKADVAAVLSHLFPVIEKAVASGDKVTIGDFGTFEAVHHLAHPGRNPATGEPMVIRETWKPKFKPAKAFTTAVTSANQSGGPA